MFDLLKSCCNKVDLKVIDEIKLIEETEFLQLILNTFPNIKPFFNQGKIKDNSEFTRTIKHVFRVFKIYFLLIENKFTHETLSKDTESEIIQKAKKIEFINENLIPLVLLYHDLGRFVQKRDHPEQSYKLIVKNDLLRPYNLNKVDTSIIEKIIQYHLLFATIYTGESTFYGTYSLLNDKELIPIISDKNYREFFIDILEIFTFIDILGYPYSQIYDHYLKYYDEINLKLKTILSYWEDKKKALSLSYNYSLSWINWRLAGALRIFQFVETEPELTVEFYFDKLDESIKKSNHPLLKGLNLIRVNEEFLKLSCKVQLKYALGFLMIIAFGKFSRSKIDENSRISDKLILFWIFLLFKIRKLVSDSDTCLWNVYILGVKNWFGLNQKQLNKITTDSIEKTIDSASFEYKEENQEYNLYLNFEEINILFQK